MELQFFSAHRLTMLTFVPNLEEIPQSVLELFSGHDFYSKMFIGA